MGAGRPVGEDGFPAGPWTPELLADAISQLDSNQAGVDLRTVQLWFQDNDKGISASNIRWLARVFGCDDPVSTSAWQVELSEAQARLLTKRREAKRAERSPAQEMLGDPQDIEIDAEAAPKQDIIVVATPPEPRRWSSLAQVSESFYSGSPLNLPAFVFAGASALGFLSYILGIDSVTYVRSDKVAKQVGFLWAPNWTFLFMVLLPLFFALVIELLAFWRIYGRSKLSALEERQESDDAWTRRVKASSSSYWAVFIICVLFAGVFQWIGVCLVPLLKGSADYATSWGTLAIIRPDIISVPASIAFTALAYLYMSLCFYLLFAGLILLHTMIHDLRKIDAEAKSRKRAIDRSELHDLRFRLLRGVFRCTIVGILVALCMKAQSAYLISNDGNIVDWLLSDMKLALAGRDGVHNGFHYRMPTHYSSLLVAVSTIVVFVYGSTILRHEGRRLHPALWQMSAVIIVLFASYLLVDAFVGSSFVLCLGVLVGLYGLVHPGLGRECFSRVGSSQRVL